jgi:hypothetical protein
MPMSRSRARAQFQNTCDILSELGKIFTSAATMAEMGKSTLKEMDRVYSVVAVSEQRRLQPESVNEEGSSTVMSSRPNGEDGAFISNLRDLADH